jgi:predicted HTH domain antitoxin
MATLTKKKINQQDDENTIRFRTMFEQEIKDRKIKFQKYYADKLNNLNNIDNNNLENKPTDYDLFIIKLIDYLNIMKTDLYKFKYSNFIKNFKSTFPSFILLFYKDTRLLYTGTTLMIVSLILLLLRIFLINNQTISLGKNAECFVKI